MARDAWAIARVAKAIGELSSVPSQASKEAAKEIERLIRRQFSTGTDPYGKPWANLSTGGRSYLLKTRHLIASIHVKPRAGAGIVVTVDTTYAKYLQTGTARMPARKILPENRLPRSWELAIERAIERVAKRRWQQLST